MQIQGLLFFHFIIFLKNMSGDFMTFFPFCQIFPNFTRYVFNIVRITLDDFSLNKVTGSKCIFFND